MYDFGNSFHVDLDKLKAKDNAIVMGDKYRFTVLTERLIRLEYSPTSTFNDYKTELVSFRDFDIPKFDIKQDDKYLEIETAYFKLIYSKETPFKGTMFNPAKNLKIEEKEKGFVWYYNHPEAKNYFGNNISAEVKKREKKENRGLFSLDGVVSFDDSNTYRINEIGSVEEPIKDNIDIYVFIYNKDFGLCVQDYFKLTGLPALIPRYALGNWWSRDIEYTDEDVYSIVNEFEKREIPLSVFLFDKDWHIRDIGSEEYERITSKPKEVKEEIYVEKLTEPPKDPNVAEQKTEDVVKVEGSEEDDGLDINPLTTPPEEEKPETKKGKKKDNKKVLSEDEDIDPDKKLETGFTFNMNLIQQPDKLIESLHSKGIRVGLQINPQDGIYPHEANYETMKEFIGYTGNGIIHLDPLNPIMLDAFLKYGVEPLEQLGVDFFWNDYKNTKDLDRLWILNNYMFKDLSRDPAKRGMILSRNSLKAAHKLPVLYAGESIVGWQNFKSTPFFNLSASNIGVCWWSHDIGGFQKGIEDPELYIRSVELGTFSPILRFHSAGGKYYKREPWKWDPITCGIVAKYLKLRHRLTSYLYTEAYKYHKTGSMIFQPLYYYLPKVYDNDNYKIEYFFGSELLVAPIINKKNPIMNRTIHKFYLPEGVWYEFTTGKRFPGNKKYVSFYKEEDYPIFAKKGSIIPLSNKSNINNTSNPTDIEIHVFPGKNNTYRLYEDDGISSLYEEGYYLITEIDYNYLQNNYTLIIRSIEGKTGIVPAKRNYKIRFRNTKYAEDVIVYFDSHKIEVKDKYVEDNDFIVELEDVPTIGQLTINCKGKDIEIDAVHVFNEDLDEILNDLQIQTELKEKIADILFSDKPIKEKRFEIIRLKKQNLDRSFSKLFLKILDIIKENDE